MFHVKRMGAFEFDFDGHEAVFIFEVKSILAFWHRNKRRRNNNNDNSKNDMSIPKGARTFVFPIATSMATAITHIIRNNHFITFSFLFLNNFIALRTTDERPKIKSRTKRRKKKMLAILTESCSLIFLFFIYISFSSLLAERKVSNRLQVKKIRGL